MFEQKQAPRCGEIRLADLEKPKSTSDRGARLVSDRCLPPTAPQRHPACPSHVLGFRVLIPEGAGPTMQEAKCFFFTHELFCSASFAELGNKLSVKHACTPAPLQQSHWWGCLQPGAPRCCCCLHACGCSQTGAYTAWVLCSLVP